MERNFGKLLKIFFHNGSAGTAIQIHLFRNFNKLTSNLENLSHLVNFHTKNAWPWFHCHPRNSRRSLGMMTLWYSPLAP